MFAARRTVMLLAVAALAAPAAAQAQSGLGPTPPTPPSSGGSGGSGGSSSGSGGTRPQVQAAAGGLPHTGLDVPGIALLGLGLIVSGAGLRLRTLDERVF
jgi:hypothetical protein